ncbi:SCP2 sterol-binding domain-containing protein [Anaeromyxobacter oryzisoli]|jgi:SCP-2 sterol transfer family protein|uniref:SCP2 sterol-binding domain-containing protein n=1 Tax=Anaeromyxobacter oryzisoli TaxID=2925408 RepID=UPI001F59412C|nr:SCP2 sterol-binding domain-containing protein [Anaeromyxobacter sp. SG63]
MAEPASSVKDVFERILPARLQARPDVVAKINAVYRFDIGGAAGGSWSLDCTAPGGRIAAGPIEDADAGCVVAATDHDFVDIVNGKLNAQMAFMSGKLRIQGDIGLALKLQQILT